MAAYDAEDNEFDTLDGVQIAWYVGANKDIARIEVRNFLDNAHSSSSKYYKRLTLGPSYRTNHQDEASPVRLWRCHLSSQRPEL